MVFKNKRLCFLRVIFAALSSIPLGYFLYASGSGSEGADNIYNWLFRRPTNPIDWAAFGAVLGLLWHMISELNKNSN